MKKIILATRGSVLALAQASQVKKLLEKSDDVEVGILKVTTKGDVNRTSPLSVIGGNGLFVRGIEEALLDGRADIAVHCGKDLPYELHEDLCIGGVPKAASAGDLLIAHHGALSKAHPVIGTGSPRRAAELKRRFGNAVFAEIRGNIGTRVEKLKRGDYDAIVLAAAGPERCGLDLTGLEVTALTAQECIPAACQGILAVECRKEDREVRSILSKITDAESSARFQIERYLFCRMKADCTMPVGVYTETVRLSDAGNGSDAGMAEGNILAGQIRIRAMLKGRHAERIGNAGDYRLMCDEIAEELCREE